MSLADGGVNDLQGGNAEGGCLSRARLCLGNGVATFADLDNGTRLHGRGRLVPVCVDAAQKILLQVHRLEGRSNADLFGRGELHALLRLAIDAFVRHGKVASLGVLSSKGVVVDDSP